MTEPRHHYTAAVIPFLVAATVLGIARLPAARRAFAGHARPRRVGDAVARRGCVVVRAPRELLLVRNTGDVSSRRRSPSRSRTRARRCGRQLYEQGRFPSLRPAAPLQRTGSRSCGLDRPRHARPVRLLSGLARARASARRPARVPPAHRAELRAGNVYSTGPGFSSSDGAPPADAGRGAGPGAPSDDPIGGAPGPVAWCSVRRWALVVWGAMALWSVALFAVVRSDYLGFRLSRFDLGNMVQAVWSTAHGRPLEMTSPATGEQVARLAFHVDPILALLTPLWLLVPSPLTLAGAQIVVCALGALPSSGSAGVITGPRSLPDVLRSPISSTPGSPGARSTRSTPSPWRSRSSSSRSGSSTRTGCGRSR